MQPISDLASYARRGHGGARLARRIDGTAGSAGRTVKRSCQRSCERPITAEVAAGDHLAGDFARGEIALQAEFGGEAELAVDGAADLAGDADGGAGSGLGPRA